MAPPTPPNSGTPATREGDEILNQVQDDNFTYLG